MSTPSGAYEPYPTLSRISGGYRASRRDRFAIAVANRWLRLVATPRCVELLDSVYRRGLDPLGTGTDDCDYTALLDYEDGSA